MIFMIACSGTSAQGRSVSGYVRDQNGEAVAGAEVSLWKDSDKISSTQTNNEGLFRFDKIGSSIDRIRISHAGFADHETRIDNDELDILLTPAAVAEIVTVGHTESRLGDTPQSVVILNRNELRSDPAATLDEKL
jgi:hypothetical protein